MRTLACALLLLAACSDSKNGPKDAPSNGDGQPGDGATADAPACEPAPLAACGTPVSGSNVTLRRIMPNVAGAPLLVTSPKNDPRMFIVERSGLIYVYENEVKRATPFLDVSGSIAAGGEQGLLGLAFHPSYGCNGEFFIFYTTNASNIVARCTVSTADPNVANPTCTPILTIPDFASNHNGGMMEFGPDGFLYIGTGDGGGGGDPRRNGQSLTNGSPQANSIALLGKMLRIDVNTKAPGKEYGIPPTNPFAAGGGAPEIFLIGLRNPWRWSFDKGTGDLWIGDVGQVATEELTVLKAGEQAGKNLGWSVFEGNGCCLTQGDKCDQNGSQAACDMTNKVFPQNTRSHPTWISIIAGETYRGTCYPDLVGWHFYTDHSAQAAGLHKARLTANGTFETVPVTVTMPSGVSSIHADARGELYMTTIQGGLYHLEATP
ncbi:MAG: Glucose/sorbosone dehydrogenase-like protein [Myxococcales bacterium]|nr:Glucose/sorbosone dehydrogenase-like protein [Myxococcales bacterium]